MSSTVADIVKRALSEVLYPIQKTILEDYTLQDDYGMDEDEYDHFIDALFGGDFSLAALPEGNELPELPTATVAQLIDWVFLNRESLIVGYHEGIERGCLLPPPAPVAEQSPEGLQMRYFVLSPGSRDPAHAEASVAAMRAYADAIKPHNERIAGDVLAWLDATRPKNTNDTF